MPPGCVQCANGEIQCGSDTNELCAAGGGWTPAGAICLQFFVKKHPKTGDCIIRVQPTLQGDCEGTTVVVKKAKSKKKT